MKTPTETERVLEEDIKITWYRTPVDRDVMKGLMTRNDGKALRHALLHWALFCFTATIAYLLSHVEHHMYPAVPLL